MNEQRRTKYKDFVEQKAQHPRQAAVLARVERAIERQQTDGGVIVLTGPTGVGKTNLVERVRWDAIQRWKAHGAPSGLLPFLGVTAPPPLHDTFRFPALFREIIEKADAILRLPRTHPAHYKTSDALEQAAMNVLRYRQPQVFCIDEAQHITYAVRERRLAQHLDLVKWIASESKRPVLMVGTYELLRFSRISGQLGRRVEHIAFTPYDWLDETDRADFRRALRFFVDRLPVRLAIDAFADEHFRVFYLGCLGSVGLLKEWLQRALHDCLSEERGTITLADLTAARMPKGKLRKIAEEMEHGRLELKYMNGDADDEEIERLLGMRSAEPTAIRRPRQTRLPGIRATKRDPVGPAEAA